MERADKELVWLYGEIKSPPFGLNARRSIGELLRRVQRGAMLTMPMSRPMPSIGPRCHELRVRDPHAKVIWRIVYRIDSDAILIGDVFAKKTQKTPQTILNACKRRFALYDLTSE